MTQAEGAEFTLGAEVGAHGRFVRQGSRFRGLITADGRTPDGRGALPAQAGRYHLYVSPACPWSHRVIIVRRLKGLEEAISMSEVDPFRDSRGWAFSGGRFTDPVNGFSFLSEAYEATEPGYDERVSVPVLWDRVTGRIVSNESGDLVRTVGAAFDELAAEALELYPADRREEIDAINELVYTTVNNGVYEAGFASTQAAYEEAFKGLFATLDQLEDRLGRQRYLVGDDLTEADWRLFPTLVRFDSVYFGHFKCNRRRLVDYPALWGYARELYQHPGVAETVQMDQIKRHYYTTHPMLNPSRIIPLGPSIDFSQPHGRG